MKQNILIIFITLITALLSGQSTFLRPNPAVLGASIHGWISIDNGSFVNIPWNTEAGQLDPSTLFGIPMWFQDLDDRHVEANPLELGTLATWIDWGGSAGGQWSVYTEVEFSENNEGQRMVRILAGHPNTGWRVISTNVINAVSMINSRIGLFGEVQFQENEFGEEAIIVQARAVDNVGNPINVSANGHVFVVWDE